MIDRFPGIAEGDARGELAATFADIRATIGVPVVNLVWRHLATIDGGLDWAWRSVRPLYVSGDVFMLAGTVRAGLVLPGLGSLVGPEPAGIDAVLASYDHSNTVNLVALSALLADARAGQAVAGHAAPLVAPQVRLSPLLAEKDVAPETWRRVLALNRLGDAPSPAILASMYRHLAHWPSFLARIEVALTPAAADGSLARTISANRALAERLGASVRDRLGSPNADDVTRREARHAVAAFVEHAIAKMVTICRAIRVARGVA